MLLAQLVCVMEGGDWWLFFFPNSKIDFCIELQKFFVQFGKSFNEAKFFSGRWTEFLELDGVGWSFWSWMETKAPVLSIQQHPLDIL